MKSMIEHKVDEDEHHHSHHLFLWHWALHVCKEGDFHRFSRALDAWPLSYWKHQYAMPHSLCKALRADRLRGLVPATGTPTAVPATPALSVPAATVVNPVATTNEDAKSVKEDDSTTMNDIIMWLATNAERMGEDRFPKLELFLQQVKDGGSAVVALMKPAEPTPTFRHCDNDHLE